MAYNPYPYSGYQTAPAFFSQPVSDQLAQLRQNQMQMAQQPVMPGTVPPQPVAQQAAPNSPIWVQGEEGAKAYMVAPGMSVMLLDSEKMVFYLKSSDQSGMPLPLRIFDYTERTANNPPKQQPEPQFDPSKFITREELEEILADRLKKPARAQKTKEENTDHE